MFRLAHISDPHLGPLPQATARQLASKRIFGYINWRRNRKGVLSSDILDRLVEDLLSQEPDHLAVTGDLVNLALPTEITNAQRWLSTLGAPDDVSVILGNHDAYVPQARLLASQAWQAYMTDESAGSDKPPFPYLRIRNNVALIGVNSAQATMPLMATGYFRAAQARRLTDILESCKQKGLFRVVMIHHPPHQNATHWYKRLIGASRFRRILREAGAELILHGHTHLNTRTSIPGPLGPIPVVCVPSASQGIGGHRPASRYNLFKISRLDNQWHCTVTERGHSEDNHTITELTHTALAIPNAQQ